MKRNTQHFYLLLIYFSLTMQVVWGQSQNYPLQVDLSFDAENYTLADFSMTDPNAWGIEKEEDNSFLALSGESQYLPTVRSPRNIAMLTHRKFGSFVMELDMQQTGREYGHRDLCLFFNMQNNRNFYYVHMASIADPHAHNIFLVNDEPRVAIAQKTTDGVNWGQSWHKVKIERNLESGEIKVYFDDMENPIMITEDTHFGEGYIGFGSFDDTGRFDNIKIWAPAEKPEPTGFFNSQ